jgi:hypothetical protein
MSARQAMLLQSYTPISDAPLCVGCRYRNISQLQGRRLQICGLGGFQVNSFGTCELHENQPAQQLLEPPADLQSAEHQQGGAQ